MKEVLSMKNHALQGLGKGPPAWRSSSKGASPLLGEHNHAMGLVMTAMSPCSCCDRGTLGGNRIRPVEGCVVNEPEQRQLLCSVNREEATVEATEVE